MPRSLRPPATATAAPRYRERHQDGVPVHPSADRRAATGRAPIPPLPCAGRRYRPHTPAPPSRSPDFLPTDTAGRCSATARRPPTRSCGCPAIGRQVRNPDPGSRCHRIARCRFRPGLAGYRLRCAVAHPPGEKRLDVFLAVEDPAPDQDVRTARPGGALAFQRLERAPPPRGIFRWRIEFAHVALRLLLTARRSPPTRDFSDQKVRKGLETGL